MLRCTLRVCGVSRLALRSTALLLVSARARRRREQATAPLSLTSRSGSHRGSAAAAAAVAPMRRELDEVVDDAYLYDDDDGSCCSDEDASGAYATIGSDDEDDAAIDDNSHNDSSQLSLSLSHANDNDNNDAADTTTSATARARRRARHTAARGGAAEADDANDADADNADDASDAHDIDDDVRAAVARAPVVERALGGVTVDALSQQLPRRKTSRKSTTTSTTTTRLLRPPAPARAAKRSSDANVVDDNDDDDALLTAADMAQRDADAVLDDDNKNDVAATSSTTTTSTPLSSLSQAAALQVTNPFLGLHDHLARSYRLEPLLNNATANDLLFARQERTSTAFSFLHIRATPALYTQHWAAAPQLASLHAALHAAPRRTAAATVASSLTPSVPGFTLFNNDLGFDNARVQHSYPLLVAQRLLLFPDALRHFHALCGRDGVPCDFFADIDLNASSSSSTTAETTTAAASSSGSSRRRSGSSKATTAAAAAAASSLQRDGEAALLDVLNYLEVRLPSIGFTDPFFLVLANESPSSEKVSYHVHARSMTYTTAWQHTGDGGGGSSSSEKKKKKATKQRSIRADDDDGEAKADDDDDDDDLSDCVRAVEDGDNSSKSNNSSGSSSKSKNKSKNAGKSVIAFQDYRTVKLLADEVNETLGRTVIDESCYRARGMLRCAFSAKLHSNQDVRHRGQANDPRRRLVPLLRAHDAALQRKLSHMEAVLRTMTDPEILELSFCTRHLDDGDGVKALQTHLRQCTAATTSSSSSSSSMSTAQLLRATARHRFKLLRPRHVLGAQAAQAQEYDAYGNAISPYLIEAAKWRRYKGVVAKLRTLPPRAAESYDVWIRVGLALHNFSNEDHVFDEWVRFSLKCPHKYSRETCRKKWVQFERNPDALNWRRGFNYLNSSIWRQI